METISREINEQLEANFNMLVQLTNSSLEKCINSRKTRINESTLKLIGFSIEYAKLMGTDVSDVD